MVSVADDYMIQELYADDFAGRLDLMRSQYIGFTRDDVAAWVVMNEDNGLRRGHDCGPEDFARVDEAAIVQAQRDKIIAFDVIPCR